MGRGWCLSTLQQRRGLQMRRRHLYSLSRSAEGQCIYQPDIIMWTANLHQSCGCMLQAHTTTQFASTKRCTAITFVDLQEGHHRLFAPPLPMPKQAAIERLGMGIVDKLFIRFRPKSSNTDSSAALESLPGRNVLSHQLLWKVMGISAWNYDCLAPTCLSGRQLAMPE